LFRAVLCCAALCCAVLADGFGDVSAVVAQILVQIPALNN
jgi:hypothetical protein